MKSGENTQIFKKKKGFDIGVHFVPFVIELGNAEQL